VTSIENYKSLIHSVLKLSYANSFLKGSYKGGWSRLHVWSNVSFLEFYFSVSAPKKQRLIVNVLMCFFASLSPDFFGIFDLAWWRFRVNFS